MTNIPDFYAGRNIFMTGATGFMGKVLMEKLLRSCPSIGTMYILVRSKRGVSGQNRVKEVLALKLFDKLRSQYPGFEEKVVAMSGDILEPSVGLSQADIDTLVSNVSVVFHSAATVRFDEPLRLSLDMNVLGTRKVVQLCRRLPKLEAFVHVSTAYANCDRQTILEMIYPPPLHQNKLIEACSWMTDDVIDTLTPRLVAPRPNTYTYTKAMAEYILAEESVGMPVAIVRPSIVGASWKEPMPGWVDNFNGPTGLLAAIGKGILRSMNGAIDGTADIIPVDIATNLMIAVAWSVAIERPSSIPVYNCTTGQLKQLTWRAIERDAENFLTKNPLENVARVPRPRFTTNRWWRNIQMVVDHYLPAYFMDLYLQLTNKKPIMVRLQRKLWKSVSCLEYFTSNEWVFSNDNVLGLLDRLSAEDRKVFNFDVRKIHWHTYIENYCLGTKRYALKEDLNKLPKAREQLAIVKRRMRLLRFALFLVAGKLLVSQVTVVRQLWYALVSFVLRFLHSIPVAIRTLSLPALTMSR